jgi:hypothetical protein
MIFFCIRQHKNTHWHNVDGIQHNRIWNRKKKVNFLDLTIQRERDKLNFTIYRKPTSTGIIIQNSSCHPNEHKIASNNCLTNRLYSYPISRQAKYTELGIIETNLRNNQYKYTTFTQNQNKILKTRTKNPKETKKIKMCHIYIREIRTVTKLFKGKYQHNLQNM